MNRTLDHIIDKMRDGWLLHTRTPNHLDRPNYSAAHVWLQKDDTDGWSNIERLTIKELWQLKDKDIIKLIDTKLSNSLVTQEVYGINNKTNVL